MYSLDEIVQQAKKYAGFFPQVDVMTLSEFVNFLANLKGMAMVIDSLELRRQGESLHGLTRDEVREIAHDETLNILRDCLYK